MRLPLTKIYRAFPELSHLPDEECERVLRRVRLGRRTPVVAYVAAAVVGVGVWLVVLWELLRRSGIGVPDLDAEFERLTVVSAIALGGSAAAAGLAVLLARDLLLWRAVRAHIHRARCPKCRQSLLGLPVQQITIGPPLPGEAWVRCTECGRKLVLMDLGLTPLDLVPWEQREVPGDFARVRHGGAWGTRRR